MQVASGKKVVPEDHKLKKVPGYRHLADPKQSGEFTIDD